MPFVVGEEVRDVALDGSPTDVDLSNDGKFLAVALHAEPCIRVYTTKDGKCVGEFGEGTKSGFGVAFIEGGKSLCYLTWDSKQKATLWKVSLPSGEPEKLKSLPGDRKFLERDADGTMVAVGGNAITVFDTKSAKQIFSVDCHEGAEGCAFFADKKRLWVYGSDPARLVEYDLGKGKQLRSLDGPTELGLQVTGSPDGRWLVGVGRGGHGTALYDLESDKRIESDSKKYVAFNDRRKLSGAFAFTHDSKTMLFLTGLTASLSLPGAEVTTSKTHICQPGDLAVRAASALEAPLVAFAFLKGNKVALVPTKAKK